MIESLGKSIICNALMITLKILFDSITVSLSRQIQCVKFTKPPKRKNQVAMPDDVFLKMDIGASPWWFLQAYNHIN